MKCTICVLLARGKQLAPCRAAGECFITTTKHRATPWLRKSCSYILLITRNPLLAFSSIAAGWLQESNSNHLHSTPAAQPRGWMLLPLIAHVIHACYKTNIMRARMQPCTLKWLAVSIVAETARNGQHVLPAQNELLSTDEVARLLGSKAVTNGAHVVLLVVEWV